MTQMPTIPSDEDVVAALTDLGGRADATAILNSLVGRGHSAKKAQLALQQAFERKRIDLLSDWKFGVAHGRAAA